MKSSLCQTQASGVLGVISSFCSVEMSQVRDAKKSNNLIKQLLFLQIYFFRGGGNAGLGFSLSAAFQPFSAHFDLRSFFLLRDAKSESMRFF